jgi:hypothetical protein
LLAGEAGEPVEDEIEAELELGAEGVARLKCVFGHDLDEVRVLVHPQRTHDVAGELALLVAAARIRSQARRMIPTLQNSAPNI